MDLENNNCIETKTETKLSQIKDEVPREESFLFNFPFKPYDIQERLMQVAYNVYEESKFALLESPTGTGKSLSLICSTLSWLRDHQRKRMESLDAERKQLVEKIEQFKREEEESGDWLSVQSKRQDVNRELETVTREIDRLSNFVARDQARWHAKVHGISFDDYDALSKLNVDNLTRRRESGLLISSKDKNNIDLDMSRTFCASSQDSQSSQSNLVIHVPMYPDLVNESDDVDDDMENKINKQLEQDHVKPKIYFSSRTHSQLSQFIGEIKRTKFANSLHGPPIKVTPLASRANLCVNPEVMKFKDASAINERCVEMQRETNKDKRCPYIKGKQVSLLKEEILSSVQDIEDIVMKGKTMGSCPYYATRMAIAEAEVVILPYNNIFHHDTRKASSLNLGDSIVVVDEAHNILETICCIHSAQISGQQLISAHSILSRYYLKFHNRFSPKNAEMIKIITRCLTSLIKYLDNPKKHIAEFENPKVITVNELLSTPNEPKQNVDDKSVTTTTKAISTNKKHVHHEEIMIDVMKFICASNIERFNVFKIIDYFERSQLARKLIGFFRTDSSVDLSLDISMDKDAKKNIKDKTETDCNRIKSMSQQPQGPNKRRKVGNKKVAIGEQTTTTPTRVNQVNENKKEENISEKTDLQFLIESNHNLKINSEQDKEMIYPIYKLVEFLKSLTTNLVKDGKICTVYSAGNVQESQLKFILLNPSSQFRQMTEEARSIVLAGGTMQPFNEFTELLFKPLGIDESRLKLFSCGHVITPDQLYVSTLYHGPSGRPLELSFKTRSNLNFVDEIGRTILNLTNVVPGGMVCFLPSYDYEQFCFSRWSHTGLISSIETKSKQVFREPRQASQLKLIWDQYCGAIEKGKTRGRGAVLFCVVGGKMSEGINFNDDLGRCIVMVGLPYANIRSSELQEKMNYYDKSCLSTGNRSQSSTKAGQQYYENLCIKGINQSIGRAVRHRNDYAAIVLLDRRYSSKSSIRNGLPEWLRKNLVDNERFGPMLAQVRSFFNQVTEKIK